MSENFQSLSSYNLLKQTKLAVQKEREATLKVLHLLRENQRRKLFLEKGFSSLFDYLTRGLHYSESAAYLRMSAMRLMEDVPEVESKIASGSFKLCHAASLYSVIVKAKRAKEPLSQTQKRQLVHNIDGKSKRQANFILKSLCPEFVQREVRREINDREVRVSVTISRELNEKLKRLQEVRSHRVGTLVELLEVMADECLGRWDPLVKAEKKREASARRASKDVTEKPAPKIRQVSGSLCPDKVAPRLPRSKRSRYIQAAVKLMVYDRVKGKCQFPGCESRLMLQYDHIKPFSQGGTNDASNLRLLCYHHNKYEAERKGCGWKKDEGLDEFDRFMARQDGG